MSVISDAFHTFLNTIQADFSSVFSQVKTGFSTVVSQVLSGLLQDVEAAGPDVLQIVTTAVLAVASGGTTVFVPSLMAAIAAVEKEGLIVAEHVIAGIVSSVISQLPTPSVQASASSAPTEDQVTQALNQGQAAKV